MSCVRTVGWLGVILLLAPCFFLFSPGVAAFDPAGGDLERAGVDHLRVLSYNVEKHFIADASRDATFERIFKAIHPDVIAFQEMPAWDSTVSAAESIGRGRAAAAAPAPRIPVVLRKPRRSILPFMVIVSWKPRC